MQGPLRKFSSDFVRISTRSSHKDLYKIMQAPPIVLYKNLQGKCRAQDGSRDRDPHFVRACETHVDTSQGPSDARIYKKNAAPQMDPQTATHTLREPAQLKCTWTKHKSHFVPEFTGKKLEARSSTMIKHRPLPLP